MTVPKKPRRRTLVGKRARLTRGVTTHGGHIYAAGEEFVIASTWRGTFYLRRGMVHGIRKLPRDAFEPID